LETTLRYEKPEIERRRALTGLTMAISVTDSLEES